MFSKIIKSLTKWWYNRGATYAPPVPPIQESEQEQPNDSPIPIVGAKLAWYPKAIQSSGMKVQGKYRKGGPEGAIVHFTAGRCDTEQEARDTLNWGINSGYAFFVIGPTGKVYQNFPLTHWGAHAGKSSWPSLGSSVSEYLVGIEVACAGRLQAGNKSWFGKVYPADRIRKSGSVANIQAGTYVKFTEEQEKSLFDLLVWLKKNDPKVFSTDLILGHDEVSPTRKDDPGASLSMTMPQLRRLISDKAQV